MTAAAVGAEEVTVAFEGAIVKLPELKLRLADYAKKHPGEVLLLLADRQVTLQAITELSAMAESVGFAYVQTAGQPLDSEGTSK